MKKNNQIEIQKMMDFHEGKLPKTAMRQMEHQIASYKEDKELLEGLQLIYAQEQIERKDLEFQFGKMKADFDNKLKNRTLRRNNRKVLLTQIRKMAALFFLFAGSTFLLSSCKYFDINDEMETEIVGPYDLAYGMKVSP